MASLLSQSELQNRTISNSAMKKSQQFIREIIFEPGDDEPTEVLPAVSIDQRPTQVMEAIAQAYVSPRPSPFPLVDGVSMCEQPTWSMPALSGADRKSYLKEKESASATGQESYVHILRRLLKDSGIYAIASLASPMISLVLAPFLTHNLSHIEYGVLVILNTLVTLLAGVTQLGLGDAFLRTYLYECETQSDKHIVLSTVILLLCGTSLLVAVGMIVFAPVLASVLFRMPSFSNVISITGGVIVLQNLSVPALAWLRGEGRAGLFSAMAITNLLVALVANILLVGVIHAGVAGSLIATACGYAVIVVCIIPLALLRAGLHLRLDIVRGMLAFGLPHVMNLLSGWVLQLSDRYLLEVLGSLAQTASYSVAYSLGSVLSAVVIAPFSLAWWTLMFPIAKRSDAALVFQRIFRWFSLVLLLATFALSLVGILILDLLFPVSYHNAAPIIPIIALSIMFNGIFVVVALGTSLLKKTWSVAIFITLSAVINVGCNLFLIPLYGSLGAAWATLLAYIVLTFGTYLYNQHIYPVPFEIGRFLLGLMLGLLLYAGSDLLGGDMVARGPIEMHMVLFSCIVRLLALCIYAVCLLLIGLMPTKTQIVQVM